MTRNRWGFRFSVVAGSLLGLLAASFMPIWFVSKPRPMTVTLWNAPLIFTGGFYSGNYTRIGEALGIGAAIGALSYTIRNRLSRPKED